MRRCVLLLAVAAVFPIAACSSSGPVDRSSATPRPKTPATTKPPATTYGQDAALLAARIPGCSNPAAASDGARANTGMVSKASCHLAGHVVIIYTWKDRDSQNSADELAATSLKRFASGVGWDQILGDDAGPDAQQQIATTVANALGGDVLTGTG